MKNQVKVKLIKLKITKMITTLTIILLTISAIVILSGIIFAIHEHDTRYLYISLIGILILLLSSLTIKENKQKYIDFPEEFQCIKYNDTLTIEECDNIIHIGFYNKHTPKNSVLIIVK